MPAPLRSPPPISQGSHHCLGTRWGQPSCPGIIQHLPEGKRTLTRWELWLKGEENPPLQPRQVGRSKWLSRPGRSPSYVNLGSAAGLAVFCPTRLAVGQDGGGSGLGGWRGLQEAPAWREGGRSVSKPWGGLPASPQGPKDSWAVFCWPLCPD